MNIGHKPNIGFKGNYFLPLLDSGNIHSQEILHINVTDNLHNLHTLEAYDLNKESVKNVKVYHSSRMQTSAGTKQKILGLEINTPNPQFSSIDKSILYASVSGDPKTTNIYAQKINKAFTKHATTQGFIA